MGIANLAAGIGPVEWVGYAAAIAVFATFCANTMVPLRAVALLSNVLFIAYGFMGSLYPILILHVALLPVNLWRLGEVLRLVRTTAPSSCGFNFAVLRSHMAERRLRRGEALFRRGEPADAMFLIDTGTLVVSELGMVRGPGEIVGELGILSRTRRRTASVFAQTDAVLQSLTAAKARELWFQHPGFALHLIQVLADRLIDDLAEETQALQPKVPVLPASDSS